MRRGWCLLILIAGAGGAQEERPPRALTHDEVAREMVAAHNGLRRRVGVPPLVWSDRLGLVAQKWADSLMTRGRFEHTPNSALGENLFELQGTGSGVAASPAQVVADWATEARDYDYAANSCRDVCGHYTQLVWRETKSLGCAVARGGGGAGWREVWVCEYDPPGNWQGRRPW